MKVRTLFAALLILTCAIEQPALADNPLSNIVKDVMDVTGKAVRGTAHGAAAVVTGTGNVVRNTAHGAEAMVDAAERAVGINAGEAPYHPPVAAQSAAAINAVSSIGAPAAAAVPVVPAVPAARASASPAPSATPVRQLAALNPQTQGTMSIAVDRHGNIIDSTGKLVGRVSTISTDTPPEFANQRFNVTINGAGELVDTSNRVIGHVLGSEPALMPAAHTAATTAPVPVANPNSIPVRAVAPVVPTSAPAAQTPAVQTPAVQAPAAPTSVAPSWTEDDILKNTAPLMRGLN
jgi:hypothetical protein